MENAIRYVTYVVTADEEGVRLDRWVKRRWSHLSQGILQKILRKGDIKVDGKKISASSPLVPGQIISVYTPLVTPPEAIYPLKKKEKPVWGPEDWLPLKRAILYQDDDILVLDKPSGLATQGGVKLSKHVVGLLEAWFASEQQDVGEGGAIKPYLVHRLDQETSGALMVALNPFSAAFLGKAFQERRVGKSYRAVVLGQFPNSTGDLTFFLQKRPGKMGEKMEIVSPETEGGLYSKTHYQVLEQGETSSCGGASFLWSFVSLHPLTGRTHQLRVHCLEAAGPIWGDGKYGGNQAYPLGKQPLHLHAASLTFPHPRGGTLTLESPLPSMMLETLNFLRSKLQQKIDSF
ncbi:MAG: RluA family pseudouridine synthase [Alphaproteobacteria bacterium]